MYRVRKTWEDASSQIGAYNILGNAVTFCSENLGYTVYDDFGDWVFTCKEKEETKCPYSVPARVLSKGCYGTDVKWLQWQLTYIGYNVGKSGIDGDFGPATELAVLYFQEANYLEVDGYCGPITQATIKKQGAPSVEPEPQPVPPTPTTFVPRLTIPEKGNPYYNTIGNGGYSTAIIGKPTCPGLNVYSNCVGHASSRFNEIIGKGRFVYLNYPPNAEDFIARAKQEGLTISQKPSLGAIIVWSKGRVGDPSDGAGHVAVVEVINEDGSIITSESGYNCSNPFWTTKRYCNNNTWGNSAPYYFLGFIENPAVKS